MTSPANGSLGEKRGVQQIDRAKIGSLDLPDEHDLLVPKVVLEVARTQRLQHEPRPETVTKVGRVAAHHEIGNPDTESDRRAILDDLVLGTEQIIDGREPFHSGVAEDSGQ